MMLEGDMGTAKTLDDRLDGSDLLARIKDAVSSVDQEAAVILYGSRATGKAMPGSDWDILVLSDRKTASRVPPGHTRPAL